MKINITQFINSMYLLRGFENDPSGYHYNLTNPDDVPYDTCQIITRQNLLSMKKVINNHSNKVSFSVNRNDYYECEFFPHISPTTTTRDDFTFDIRVYQIKAKDNQSEHQHSDNCIDDICSNSYCCRQKTHYKYPNGKGRQITSHKSELSCKRKFDYDVIQFFALESDLIRTFDSGQARQSQIGQSKSERIKKVMRDASDTDEDEVDEDE